MKISVVKYHSGLKTAWNEFVKSAKNSLFQFDRNYMDYHADRFTDHSLLFYAGEKLLAVLPANSEENKFVSHGGLTFGGLLLSSRIFLTEVESIFNALLVYLRENDFKTFVYKAIPHIFHTIPAQEDLYLLFKAKAMLVKRDVNSVIDFTSEITYTKGLKHNLTKARRQHLRIAESTDFETFMQIETEVLARKYQTKPTHSAAEMKLLAERFPENIKLFLVYKEKEVLGGSVVFYYPQVTHTQYSGFTEAGKNAGAFAFLTDFLVRESARKKRFFSFGISTTHHDDELNAGLVFSKESFSARTIVHDSYSLEL